MFVTDITNCNGSINPQRIDLAISRKKTSCLADKNHEMVRTYLTKLSKERSIYIPSQNVRNETKFIKKYRVLNRWES